jgi:hypothetical protein
MPQNITLELLRSRTRSAHPAGPDVTTLIMPVQRKKKAQSEQLRLIAEGDHDGGYVYNGQRNPLRKPRQQSFTIITINISVPTCTQEQTPAISTTMHAPSVFTAIMTMSLALGTSAALLPRANRKANEFTSDNWQGCHHSPLLLTKIHPKPTISNH